MKAIKRTVFIFLFFICSSSSYSQWVNYSTGIYDLTSHSFINSKTGWACGQYSGVIRTTNGGINWSPQSTNIFGISYRKIQFTDINTGYVMASDSILNNCRILKTTNGGFNWNTQYANDTINIKSIYFINNLTGWICGKGIIDGVVLNTTNGGADWTTQFSYHNTTFLNSIYFTDINTGWVDADHSIFKTTNGGINWFLQNTDSIVSLSFIYMLNSNTGYIISPSHNNLFYYTSNGGNNWVYINPVLLGGSTGTWQSMAFRNSTTGFYVNSQYIEKLESIGGQVDTVLTGFLTYISFPNQNFAIVSSRTNGVYRKALFEARLKDTTTTIGRNQSTILTLNDNLCVGSIDSVYWFVNNVLMGRQHTFTYNYLQGTSIVKLKISNNLGQIDSTISWITVGVYKKYTNGQIRAGESIIGDSIFYVVSTNNAVYKMDINGNLIYPLATGGSILSECSISYDTNVYISSSDNNLYGFKSDGSNIWPPIPLGGQASTTPTIDSASNRLYLGVSNGFFRAINRISGTTAFSYLCDAPVKNSAVLSSSRKLVVASSVGTVYGFNLNSPTPSPPSWILNLNDSILVSPVIDTLGYFYFGSRSGKIYKVALQGTTNASVIWQRTLGSPVTSSPVIDANSNLYAGTANGKLYSLKISNGNINWNFQTDSAIRSTPTITPYGRIYFGNDKGEVFGIDTNRNTKFYFIDSFKVSCSMMYSGGTLYFGNEMGRLFAFYDTTAGLEKIGRGVPIWGTFQNNVRRTGNQRDGGQSVGIQKISDIIPNKFELYQNYPNPFNPISKIKYQIANKTQVKLIVYDLLGKEVVVLVNEKQTPGIYEVEFGNNMFASGVYFYKIFTTEFTDVKKMLLIK